MKRKTQNLQLKQCILQIKSQILLAPELQVFGIFVEGGVHIDAIMRLGRLQSLIPFVGSLVEGVQQVKALTALVKLFRIFL